MERDLLNFFGKKSIIMETGIIGDFSFPEIVAFISHSNTNKLQIFLDELTDSVYYQMVTVPMKIKQSSV